MALPPAVEKAEAYLDPVYTVRASVGELGLILGQNSKSLQNYPIKTTIL